jgi:hypothetical protein
MKKKELYKEIIKMVKETPNDYELGNKIRKLIVLRKKEKNGVQQENF